MQWEYRFNQIPFRGPRGNSQTTITRTRSNVSMDEAYPVRRGQRLNYAVCRNRSDGKSRQEVGMPKQRGETSEFLTTLPQEQRYKT